ncbi:hypothetical protein PRIC1_007368 [Phytophthora ramorum]|uniref:2-5A-dependent ribonuclease n=1 Tax=Phytophthora ramorum TaxID=164328 RepID=UPI0030B11934|nr:2-5A-dependent ribonuclease [Phytophthora ramorum]KAH7502209.1 2-5A-dependent ribonuclease [Phytophthora ramorum]
MADGALDCRLKQRAFLDAATDGDLIVVDAWLSTGARGDVNVTMGEGWTALLYAVAHSRIGVVRRLLQEESIDLNATSTTGSSALTLAMARKNNTLVALLLSNGASRATLPNALWQEMASWIRADVRLMLSPDWAVVWSPALHRHFPPAEREKCRLVVYANTLALRRRERQAPGSAGLASSSSIASWKEKAMLQLGWMFAAFMGSFVTDEQLVRWRYLSPPLVDHIIEYAVYLW